MLHFLHPHSSKKNYFKIVLLFCGLLFTFGAFSQTSVRNNGDRTPGYWTLGLNGGLSYQSSDVTARLNGFGVGLTLAKNLYYAPNAPLAFDIRGRFLYARQYGLDGTPFFDIEDDNALNGTFGVNYQDYPVQLNIDDGFVFINHRTTLGELALEGLFSFNRLRERTGLHIGIFGGIGADLYEVDINQQDENGNPYYQDYIDLLGKSKREVRRELSNAILDEDYETLAHGTKGHQWAFMPSLGIELGYQLTPRFSINVGHRVTFSGTNLFDGQGWKDEKNDLYHYTNLAFRWILAPSQNSGKAPEIIFENPAYSPHTVRQLPEAVRASISNVSSKYDIEATLNGRSIDFDFGGTSFRKIVDRLQPGENNFTISAKNRFGSDRETMILIYDDPVAPPPPSGTAPNISITSPRTNPLNSNLATETLVAIIDHVDRQDQITVRMNSRNVPFTFDNRTGRISATLNLNPGNNTAIIRAENRYGNDQKQTVINYTQQAQNDYPSVQITSPDNNQSFSQERISLRANVAGVDRQSNITLTVRGYRVQDFSFDPRNDLLTATIPLAYGANVIKIVATNGSRSAQDEVTVYRDGSTPPPPPPTPERPYVEIRRPADNTTTQESTIDVEASVLYARRHEISVFVNGNRFTNFEYNENRNKLTANIPLRSGNNTFRVEARNNAGQAQDGINIRYQAPARPSVSISDPSNNSQVSQTRVQFVANTQNVSYKTEVSLTLNNRNVSDFEFRNGVIRSNLNLSTGNNTIKVRVNTPGGSDQDQVAVNFRQNNQPTVRITRPTNNPHTTENPDIQIKATVSNIDRSDQITLRYDGQVRTDFNFNPIRQEVNFATQMQAGQHTVSIRVQTDGGQAEDDVRLIYEKDEPIAPPTVTINTPANNATLTTNQTPLSVSITGVNNRRDIELLVNGNRQNTFNFQNGILQATVTLREGRNNIKVTAANAGGEREDAVQVTYQRPALAPPIITFTAPDRPGGNTTSSNQTITARVQNVNAKNQISITVNGRSIPNFNFSLRTGTVSFPLILNAGETTIIITANNKDGSVEGTTSINYNPPATGPTVTILSVSRPVDNPLNPGVGASVVHAKLVGVTSKNEITLMVNGTVINDFTFSAKSGDFNATVGLSSGENTIIIRANTRQGVGEDSETIDF